MRNTFLAVASFLFNVDDIFRVCPPYPRDHSRDTDEKDHSFTGN